MELRRLLASETPLYRKLRLEALHTDPMSFAVSPDEERRRTDDEIAAMLTGPSTAVIVAIHEAEAIGMIGFARESEVKRRHSGTIWGVYVQPKHRRTGVGQSLLQSMLSFVSQIDGLYCLRLGVNQNNNSAIQLYQANGFVVVGSEPLSMIVDGKVVHEYLMYRQLTDIGPK